VTHSRVRVSLLLGITFLAGMAAGFAADRQLARPQAAEGTVMSERRASGRGGTTIERFADELHLTETQRSAIAPVIEDTRRRMSELFEPVRPAYGELVDSARVRIEAILTPAQVTEYRQLLEREYGAEHESGPDSGND